MFTNWTSRCTSVALASLLACSCGPLVKEEDDREDLAEEGCRAFCAKSGDECGGNSTVAPSECFDDCMDDLRWERCPEEQFDNTMCLSELTCEELEENLGSIDEPEPRPHCREEQLRAACI